MSQRPLLFVVGGALVVGLGACMLNTAGLPSEETGGGAPGVTSGMPTTGVGGALGVTTGAETGATAQSSASAGGASASSASSSGSSSASSSASSSSASSSSASSSASSSSSSASSSSASSSSSGGGGVTCDSQYSGAPSYHLCSSPPNFCEFNARLKDKYESCRATCAEFGGECAAMYFNGAACGYDDMDNKGCDDDGQVDAVCRCSLGCGGGPPCTSNKTCINNACKP